LRGKRGGKTGFGDHRLYRLLSRPVSKKEKKGGAAGKKKRERGGGPHSESRISKMSRCLQDGAGEKKREKEKKRT